MLFCENSAYDRYIRLHPDIEPTLKRQTCKPTGGDPDLPTLRIRRLANGCSRLGGKFHRLANVPPLLRARMARLTTGECCRRGGKSAVFPRTSLSTWKLCHFITSAF
jgi:hypothetical protein